MTNGSDNALFKLAAFKGAAIVQEDKEKERISLKY